MQITNNVHMTLITPCSCFPLPPPLPTPFLSNLFLYLFSSMTERCEFSCKQQVKEYWNALNISFQLQCHYNYMPIQIEYHQYWFILSLWSLDTPNLLFIRLYAN